MQIFAVHQDLNKDQTILQYHLGFQATLYLKMQLDNKFQVN